MAKSARSGVVKAVGVEKGSSPLSGAARRARAGLVRSVGHSGRVDSGVDSGVEWSMLGETVDVRWSVFCSRSDVVAMKKP